MAVVEFGAPPAGRTIVVRRKSCRRDVKKTLKRLGWAPPPSAELHGDDVTKMWIAARCAACRRCPRLSSKLARWREDAPH